MTGRLQPAQRRRVQHETRGRAQYHSLYAPTGQYWAHVYRVPVGSSAAGTSLQGIVGKHGDGAALPAQFMPWRHCCSAFDGCVHPLASTQAVLPLPRYPAGQGPQEASPAGVAEHCVRRSQPPLLTEQFVRREQPRAPVPRCVAGQGPQRKLPAVFWQVVSGSCDGDRKSGCRGWCVWWRRGSTLTQHAEEEGGKGESNARSRRCPRRIRRCPCR